MSSSGNGNNNKLSGPNECQGSTERLEENADDSRKTLPTCNNNLRKRSCSEKNGNEKTCEGKLPKNMKYEEKCGFSFSGDEEIQCSDCKAQINKEVYEENQERLWRIHMSLTPSCPKLKGIKIVEEIRMKHARKFLKRNDVDAYPDRTQKIAQDTGDRQAVRHFHPPPQKPEYQSLESRRQSLERFINSPISLDDFAQAGFYFNADVTEPDKVTCFWCNGSLHGWQDGEKPWDEHAKYYPGCTFVRHQKGISFILRIRASMTLTERESSNNLIYEGDLEIFDYGYNTYNDVNSRLRSLHLGQISGAEESAHLYAKQGFYWADIDREVVKCYYCGIRMDKQLEFNTLEQRHKNLSPSCAVVKGQVETASSAQPGCTGRPSHLLILPCQCTISAAESDGFYPQVRRNCPICGSGIEVIKTFCHSMATVIMQPQE